MLTVTVDLWGHQLKYSPESSFVHNRNKYVSSFGTEFAYTVEHFSKKYLKNKISIWHFVLVYPFCHCSSCNLTGSYEHCWCHLTYHHMWQEHDKDNSFWLPKSQKILVLYHVSNISQRTDKQTVVLCQSWKRKHLNCLC